MVNHLLKFKISYVYYKEHSISSLNVLSGLFPRSNSAIADFVDLLFFIGLAKLFLFLESLLSLLA